MIGVENERRNAIGAGVSSAAYGSSGVGRSTGRYSHEVAMSSVSTWCYKHCLLVLLCLPA